MASIRKRGKTYAVVFYNGENENRKQEWQSGFTFAQAKKRKAQIELEEAQGIKEHLKRPVLNDLEENVTNSLSLKSFMIEFFDIYGRKKWGNSYYKSSQRLLENYVYNYWSNALITDFTVKSIDEYYTWLISECRPATSKHHPRQQTKFVSLSVVNDIHKVLRCAFNQAKKWQYIPSNPFLDASVPEYKQKERPALTPSEIEQVLEYTDNPDNYNLYLIHCAINLAFSGSMRGGEVGGLQWADIVDEQRRILYINKTVDRVDKSVLSKIIRTEIFFKFPSYTTHSKSILVLKNTKECGGSDRNCYLPEAVYLKLMKLRQMQEHLKNELGSDGYFDFDLMICQENGRPIMTEHLNRFFQSVLNEMGIKPKHGNEQYVFHSIRSTATTYKLRLSHGDIKAVQGENGQKDPKMVTHQYSRILDEDRIKLAEAMNDDFYCKDERKSEESEMLSVIQKNPELFKQFMAFVSANNLKK